MKRIVILLLILSTFAAAANPHWKKFDQGMKQAKQSGKKILIDVYTDWCGWCKKMDAATYTDKKVLNYLKKNFVVIKLNADDAEKINYAGRSMTPAEFSQEMGINGYPATLFLKSNGEAITLLPGYAEAKMFIHVLNFIGENHYENMKFADYLAEKGITL
ncbi:MAG: thioredoxin fold domain-containing protein [Bacteriovoracaceae bacterium]|nr:DUF255 domain-containing protein [Bacteroidota bacterium]